MLYQRYTTAILDGYRDRPDAPEQLVKAQEFRRWLESLAIDDEVKGMLVEQAVTIETAFARLAERV